MDAVNVAFTEKPAGMNPQETAEMAEAAERKGVKSASGMIQTYGYFVESREFIDCIKNDTVPLTNLWRN